jgi:hypothetical protein
MSFGTSNSESGSISQIDPRLYADWQALNNAAKATADIGFTPYTGQRVAADNMFEDYGQYRTLQAADMGQGAIGHAQNVYGQIADQSPYFFEAAQTGDVLDVNPERASVGSVGGSDLSRYLNPYTSSVVDQANAQLERQRQMAQNQNAYAASRAGAFGGSRHGVVDAENNRTFAQMKTDSTNALLQGGYDRATGLATSDLDRGAQASMFNAGQMNAAQTQNANLDYTARAADADRRQAAAIANAGIDQANTQANLQAAQGLLASGAQQQQQYLTGANALAAAGASQRAIDQSNLDAQYEAFLRQIAAPQDRLNILAQPFGLIPSNQQSTSSSSAKSVSGGR